MEARKRVVDERPDAGGFATIRPTGGSPNGETEAQPIATVYDWEPAALIKSLRLLDAALAEAGIEERPAKVCDESARGPAGPCREP